MTAAQPLSKDELKKKLIELCQQRDLPYGYYVETFGPRLTPRLLYKVWTKDGHEELVRGAAFGDLDIRALRSDLIAAGDESYVDNHLLNIPHSIVGSIHSVRRTRSEASQPEQGEAARISRAVGKQIKGEPLNAAYSRPLPEGIVGYYPSYLLHQN